MLFRSCLRNHALIQEVNAGRGPIHMVTMEAFQDPHLEEIGWHNFLGMTVGVMPITGIPLPFFSYGGSFLVTCCVCVALALRIAWDSHLAGYARFQA